MSTKNNHRRRHAQKVRMLQAAARRAQKRGNDLDAAWARAQLEMRTGETMPEPVSEEVCGK